MPRLKPNTFKEVYCPDCGTKNTVIRNQVGLTTWWEWKAKRGRLHDDFRCPHWDEDWHKEAEALHHKIEEKSSGQMRELYQLELDELLAAHGCQLPESGVFRVVFDEVREMRGNIIMFGKNYLTIENEKGDKLERYSIHYFDNRFYTFMPDYEFEDDMKDFMTFAEAFENYQLNTIINDTTSIYSDVFAVDQILDMMKIKVTQDRTVLINGKTCWLRYDPPEEI